VYMEVQRAWTIVDAPAVRTRLNAD